MSDAARGTTREHWPVVELRQYTLHPGAWETLVDLFDREFVETQEDVGMRVVGQFRDEEDPDRFVWVRAFAGMEARAAALTAFYLRGAAWAAHRAAANATMVDSSDVLLLRPVSRGSGFPLPETRPPVGTARVPASHLTATICRRDRPVDDDFVAFFLERVRPVLAEAGIVPVAWFETEPAENTFPRLPVREGEHVFVWFAAFPDAERRRSAEERLARCGRWNAQVLPALRERLAAPVERLLLAPTARSLLR